MIYGFFKFYFNFLTLHFRSPHLFIIFFKFLIETFSLYIEFFKILISLQIHFGISLIVSIGKRINILQNQLSYCFSAFENSIFIFIFILNLR